MTSLQLQISEACQKPKHPGNHGNGPVKDISAARMPLHYPSLCPLWRTPMIYPETINNSKNQRPLRRDFADAMLRGGGYDRATRFQS